MIRNTNTHLLAIALLCLILSACNNDEKQIRRNAQRYLEATGNYLIEEAYPYATKNTCENALPFMTDVILPMTDTNYIKANTPATISIDSVVIIEDTAWVLYTKATPLRRLKNQIHLLKEDGKWLVDVQLAVPENLPLGKRTMAPDTVEHELRRMLPDSTEQVVKFRIPQTNPDSTKR